MPQIETVEEFKRRLGDRVRSQLKFLGSDVIIMNYPAWDEDQIRARIAGARETLEWILRDVLQVSII